MNIVDWLRRAALLNKRARARYIEAADEITRLRTLVEEAYKEGFQEGKDGGWIVGPETPWKKSDALASLKKNNMEKNIDA